ncbi:hypothetical protein ACFYRN_25045 [Streptomyces sp. NPDC005227]|uniref:hypothetical protein n=1 Tax=Streptomyces sp. NPDC005227 TaxID=3364707 RepID=UPI0036C0D44C
MSVIINPGSGPVPEATEAHAAVNVTVFGDDLKRAGIVVTDCARTPGADYGDGRFAFNLTTEDGRTIAVQMPGLPVERVRWLGEEGQNIWDFPRLYVDDSSWVWQFALSACEPDEEDDQ